jgi:dTDP-4-dehydrorhamnose reductase
MRILVTGGRGQLGRRIAHRGVARGHEVLAPDVDELDICDGAAVARSLEAFAPGLVINGAAYTAVDRAETDRDRAFAINAAGVATLSRACAGVVALVHVSTDYVFDGTGTAPYREDDPTSPLGVYGASKAAGERHAIEAGATVVRTSWLFGEGGPSFVQTMLRLAQERTVLRVVADQRGCPTWADDLADALIDLADRPRTASLYHYCGDGPTTWHEFAIAIVEAARRHRTIACERVDAITTAEYPTAARRPAYSVLDTTRIRALGIVPASWKVGLEHVVARELGG